MDNNHYERLEILKTYKIFIGGKFTRTESGRFYAPAANGKALGNVCLSSRKDMRNAVVSARSAQPMWWSMTAYLRGQILYRIAEMLEGRREQFLAELQRQGETSDAAKTQVDTSIDRVIYYAGWCDKYQQIFSCVNPVASSHFNFSIFEPTGVVFLTASETSPLLGLISLLTPIIAGGNSVVVLASQSKPFCAITLAEVLATSDVPAGVVNILTGDPAEIVEHAAKHLDINAIAVDRRDSEPSTKLIQELANGNVKRIKVFDRDWSEANQADPYLIQDFCEIKTTWHPIEQISVSGSGY